MAHQVCLVSVLLLELLLHMSNFYTVHKQYTKKNICLRSQPNFYVNRKNNLRCWVLLHAFVAVLLLT